MLVGVYARCVATTSNKYQMTPRYFIVDLQGICSLLKIRFSRTEYRKRDIFITKFLTLDEH